MTEKRRELYHCDRCGELFRAPVVPAERVVCSLCGHPPFKAIHANLDRAELAAENEAGQVAKQQDQADFTGMKRSKRSRQLRMAFFGWMTLLLVGGASAIYYKTKQEDLAATQAKQQQEENYEKLLFNKRQINAVKQASVTIRQFVAAPDVNSRSQWVHDGVRLLLEMQEYYDSRPPLVVEGALSVQAFKLREEGEVPVLELLLSDGADRLLEAVFIKEGNRWKIDWSHFVRYSRDSWNRFLLAKEPGRAGQFRLYVRQRAVRRGDDKSTMHLIFYEPKIFDGDRGVKSPEVRLNRYTETGKQIAAALEEAEKEDGEGEVLGRFDPPGLARVNVELEWVMEGGAPKLVIRELLATDWLTGE